MFFFHGPYWIVYHRLFENLFKLPDFALFRWTLLFRSFYAPLLISSLFVAHFFFDSRLGKSISLQHLFWFFEINFSFSQFLQFLSFFFIHRYISLHPLFLHLPNFFSKSQHSVFLVDFSLLLLSSAPTASAGSSSFSLSPRVASHEQRDTQDRPRGGSKQLFLLGFHSVDRSFAHNGYRITRGWSSSPLANALLYPLARLLIRALIKFTMVNERTERMKRVRKKEGKWKRRRWNVVRFFRMSWNV